MTGLHPLTTEQVSLLKQTFRMLDADRFAMRFYSSLFAKYPQVRNLFPANLGDLSGKIMSVFQLVVHSFAETSPGKFELAPDVIKPLRALGSLHSDKGVLLEHYPLVNDMIIINLRAELPHAFTPEAENVWKLALNHLTFAMLNPQGETTIDGPTSMKESFEQIKAVLFKK